ncbi:MAG: hypothetical protein ACRD3P_09765 [Terriglobales bacterium]
MRRANQPVHSSNVGGITLGIEIFFGFIIGGLLLAFGSMVVLVAWHIFIAVMKALWNRTKALCSFLADHIRWVIGIVVYCWIAGILGSSDSPTQVGVAGVMYTALIVAGLIGAYVLTSRAGTRARNRELALIQEQERERSQT